MKPEDPRTVHHVVPCEVARSIGSYYYPQHYIGVNCTACLDNRPPPKIKWDNNSTALKITIWLSSPMLTILLILLALIMFKEGKTPIGVFFAIPPVIIVGSLLFKLLTIIIKPITSRILAKRYDRPQQ